MKRRLFQLPALVALLALTILTASPAVGQEPVAPENVRPANRNRPANMNWRSADNVVVPQRSAMSSRANTQLVQITGVRVGVVIREMVATTTMEISLQNPSGRMLEAVIVNPVPVGAVIRHFDFEGGLEEPGAELIAKGEARATYDDIVRRLKDPALLEFIGFNLIRSSVFPVPANGTQKVRLTYEHLLVADGNRVDYILPRSEALDYRVPWTINVRLKSQRKVAAVYSPSHPLKTQRADDHQLRIEVPAEHAEEPGPFRLSYVFGGDGMSATMFTYPDASAGEDGGGYFLLVAGLTADAEDAERPAIRREVTLVIDRSGSMGGEKIEQARAAMLQVLNGLGDGEAFNIIDFSNTVGRFASEPVIKSAETIAAARRYVQGIRPAGGTNIHDALVEALRQPVTEGTLPIVMFITDGLPTVGQTAEVTIRNVATKSNPHNRRIFSFGVGSDVNTPLLDKIGLETRATSTYVLPGEDVEVKVGQVFERLAGPVMASLSLKIVNEDGTEQPGRVRDVLPGALPDLFDGDQLVLLGQYVGDEPVKFRVSGNYLGAQRAFEFGMDPAKASTRNSFVPRMWASRQIALLVDEVRQLGADPGMAQRQAGADAVGSDPALKEIVSAIVRLSTEFGILTEYTAFLALDGSNLSTPDDVLCEAEANLRDRAMNTRSGVAGVNQSLNNNDQRNLEWGNRRNGYWDHNMNRVEVTGVQQVNDRAFFRRNGNWVDADIIRKDATGDIEPKKVIEFGTEEYAALIGRLVTENRQGTLALQGDVILVIDGEAVLVKGPTRDAEPAEGDTEDAEDGGNG